MYRVSVKEEGDERARVNRRLNKIKKTFVFKNVLATVDVRKDNQNIDIKRK